MAIYDIDYNNLVANILPPNKRLPRFLQFLRSFVKPLGWNHSNFFGEYAQGSGAPLWSSTNTYAVGNKVNSWFPFDTNINNITNTSFSTGYPRQNAVYECQFGGKWPILCAPQQDYGTGAELVSSLDNTGGVSGIGIKNGGSGYGVAAQLYFVGQGGTLTKGFLDFDNNNIKGTATVSAGAVTSVAISGFQATQYVVPPTVYFFSLFGGGAIGVPILDNGIVTGVTIVNGGSGYLEAPAVYIYGGTTRGKGEITQVRVPFPGTGYTEAPQVFVGSQWQLVTNDFRGATKRTKYNGHLGTLTWILNEYFHTTFRNFSSPIGLYGWSTGGGATLGTVSVVSGEITNIAVITAGSAYSEPPLVYISDDTGVGATAYAVVEEGEVKSINISNKGSGYSSTPEVTLFGGGQGIYQQAHSDIFISTLSEVGNIFFVGAIDAESSYVIADNIEIAIPFVQYVGGTNGISNQYAVWIPLTYWNNIVVEDIPSGMTDEVLKFTRENIFRTIIDKYAPAGVSYVVLPY